MKKTKLDAEFNKIESLRKDWFKKYDPWYIGTEKMYYRSAFKPTYLPFKFPMKKDEEALAKRVAAEQLVDILFLENNVTQISEDIVFDDYSVGDGTDEVFLLARVDNFSTFLEKNRFVGKKLERTIYNFHEKLDKLIQIVEKISKNSKKNKRIYQNFSFGSLHRDLVSVKSTTRQLDDDVVLVLKEDYSILDIYSQDNPDSAAKTKYSALKNTEVCSVLYFVDQILAEFPEESLFGYENEDNFINNYVKPRPEVTFSTNFGATDKLIDMILGDASLLNGKYKPTREEYKEGFKEQLFAEIRNESESVNDPALNQLLSNMDNFGTIDALYEEVLNRVPVESLIALAVKCLAKLIPVDEIKKVICSKIVRTISKSELSMIADYLEMIGDEANSLISKEISELDLDENSEALLQYTLSNPDRETLICLAVFAVIPAAIYLLSQLLGDENSLKDKIKEDYNLVKKAVDKRIDYFFDDSLGVFDILAAVRDGLIEAAESFIAQTFLFIIQKILNTIDQACDTKEQDFANTSFSPLAQLNINDLLRKTETNRNKPPAFTEPNLKLFLNELSNILSLTEMCLLLNGNFKDAILDKAMNLLAQPQHQALAATLNLSTLKTLFERIGDNIDKSYCEDALAKFEQQKKILIEICTDTTQLKKDLYDQLYGGAFSPDDILRQIQMESDLNKARLEALVDAMRPQDFMPKRKCAEGRHKSEEFLSNTVVRENIKAIGKRFEQDASGFKQIFLGNNDYINSLENAVKTSNLSKKNEVAPGLKAYLKDKTKVESVSQEENVVVTFPDGFYSALENRTTLALAEQTRVRPKNIFQEFNDVVLSKNSINKFVLAFNKTEYFDKIFETAVETLLRRVSENNPLLTSGQIFRNYPIVSWEKSTDATCVGPLFSVEEIMQIHRTVWAIYCESGQPEPDKLAMLKIAYDIYLYVICLQHCLKAIFSVAVFEQSEISNPNSFIVSKITEEAKESFGLNKGSTFGLNYKKLVAAQYKEDSFDINFGKEVAYYTTKAFGKIFERSKKEKFFDNQVFEFGEKDALHSLKSLSAFNNKPVEKGFYTQQYFRMTPNPNFESTLSPELKEIYNNLRFFLVYKVEKGEDTFGLDALFLPGIFKLEGEPLIANFDTLIPELSLDYTAFPEKLKELYYLRAYDLRGVVVREDVTLLRNRLKDGSKPADDSAFFKFCDEFNKYLSGLGFFDMYKIYGTNQLVKVLLTILDKPITDFFLEIKYGERLTVVVNQEELLSANNSIETVTEKIGNTIPYHVQLQLLVEEEDVSEVKTARDFIFNGIPTWKKPEQSLEEAAKVASAIDLDFVEDIAVYMAYAAVEQIYGTQIEEQFKGTRYLAKKNVEVLSRLESYEESTERVTSPSLSPGAIAFNVFDVVLGALLKAGANMTDPTWKTIIPGPLTPIGWAAKLYDADQPPVNEEPGPPKKKEICEDN
jgi:hypothetical protein